MATLNEIKPKAKVLFLQLDNVYRENKNTNLMKFMSYLVQYNYFEKIEVSFLIVGHTHNDLDQIFSLISKKIFPCIIPDLELLRELVVESTANLIDDKVSLEKENQKERKKK